jgi:hypothetical protein
LDDHGEIVTGLDDGPMTDKKSAVQTCTALNYAEVGVIKTAAC